MTSRLTRGKTVIGSLEVRDKLTVRGVPVGAGGATGTPIQYTMFWDNVNDPMAMYRESWSMSMGSFTIRNTNTMLPNAIQNFLTNNNIQTGDRFDITDVEYFKASYIPGQMDPVYAWTPIGLSGEYAGYNFYAVAILDYMSGEPQLRIGTYGNATYSMMGNAQLRFNLRKKA